MTDPVTPTPDPTPAPAPAPDPTPAPSPTSEAAASSTSDSTDLGGTSDASATEAAAAGSDKPDDGTTTDLGAEDKPTDTPANEMHGAPEGDYSEFTVPDGSTRDPVLLGEFTPLAKELGLSQKGAQKLVDFKSKLDQRAIQAWGDHVKDLRTQAQADPEIGGTKYQASIAAGRDVIKKFAPAGFTQMLNSYGIGNHPLMIKFMTKIAAATGENPIPPNNGGSGGSVDKPLHEIFYGSSSDKKG